MKLTKIDLKPYKIKVNIQSQIMQKILRTIGMISLLRESNSWISPMFLRSIPTPIWAAECARYRAVSLSISYAAARISSLARRPNPNAMSEIQTSIHSVITSTDPLRARMFIVSCPSSGRVLRGRVRLRRRGIFFCRQQHLDP